MLRTILKKTIPAFRWKRGFALTAEKKERLLAICPIDGRYKKQVPSLSNYFSECALIKYRVKVELEWFKKLLEEKGLVIVEEELKSKDNDLLESIVKNFTVEDAQQVKDIEGVTNHDMKAVEYFIKDKIKDNPKLKALGEYIHFTCTSEDVNNLAYGLLINDSTADLLQKLNGLLSSLLKMSTDMADAAMMARTHGQLATPTTMGKEMANYVFRLGGCIKELQKFKANGKFNGATGNFNAHLITCPKADWIKISRSFVENLGLNWIPFSTQIEQHDGIASLFQTLERINTILIGLCRDIWMYTSYGYFKLKVVKGEVGSSTMPHKVNPIFFENAEGNLGLANALLSHFASKLPISRMQRDLSDSTVIRNIGVAFGYSEIAYSSIETGLSRLDINKEQIKAELDRHYELLAEAVQTVMRRYKKEAPYERLKEFTRGKEVTQKDYQNFVEALDLPLIEKKKLMELTPSKYLGLAEYFAKSVSQFI